MPFLGKLFSILIFCSFCHSQIPLPGIYVSWLRLPIWNCDEHSLFILLLTFISVRYLQRVTPWGFTHADKVHWSDSPPLFLLFLIAPPPIFRQLSLASFVPPSYIDKCTVALILPIIVCPSLFLLVTKEFLDYSNVTHVRTHTA
jgi:hypothetical protein